MKSELIAGDTLSFITSVPQYPPGDGWALSYRLIPRDGVQAFSFEAEQEGDDYRAHVSAATTSLWPAGEYTWVAFVTRGGERFTVDHGTALVKPDVGVVHHHDGRTHARKVLEAINAVLENRATKDQQQYSIGSRQLSRTPLPELLILKSRYEWIVHNEEVRAKMAAGLPDPRKIGVRFGRA